MADVKASIAGKGLEGGEFKTIGRDSPELDKFKKMSKCGLPQGAVENAMVSCLAMCRMVH